MTITKSLNGITVKELMNILKDVPPETEISVWSPDVSSIEIQVSIYDALKMADVDIDIETYPSW